MKQRILCMNCGSESTGRTLEDAREEYELHVRLGLCAIRAEAARKRNRREGR